MTNEEESLLDEVNRAHQAVSVIREEIMEVIDMSPDAKVKVSRGQGLQMFDFMTYAIPMQAI